MVVINSTDPDVRLPTPMSTVTIDIVGHYNHN